MVSTIDIDVFARQLIADKCSALIESQQMLPPSVLVTVKRARDDYFANPSPKNYDNLKKLFNHTKYADDAIDMKDFNRRLMLIMFKFGLNKCKNYFKNYQHVLEVALRRLDTIDPDLKSSPRALLQHYNQCLDALDNPRHDEHHLVTFGKEIATKIFIETIDLYSGSNKSAITLAVKSPAALATNNQLLTTAIIESTRKRCHSQTVKIVKPLFFV